MILKYVGKEHNSAGFKYGNTYDVEFEIVDNKYIRLQTTDMELYCKYNSIEELYNNWIKCEKQGEQMMKVDNEELKLLQCELCSFYSFNICKDGCNKKNKFKYKFMKFKEECKLRNLMNIDLYGIDLPTTFILFGVWLACMIYMICQMVNTL